MICWAEEVNSSKFESLLVVRRMVKGAKEKPKES